MKYFKDDKNAVYAYEDDVDEKYVKSGLVAITEGDALQLANPDQKKTALRVAADAEIEWRQYAVDKGIATAEESAALDEWSLYRVQLMRINTDTAPDIEWPAKPILT